MSRYTTGLKEEDGHGKISRQASISASHGRAEWHNNVPEPPPGQGKVPWQLLQVAVPRGDHFSSCLPAPQRERDGLSAPVY